MRGLARIGDVPSAAVLRQKFPCWRKVPHRSFGAAAAHLRSLKRNPFVKGGGSQLADRVQSLAVAADP